MQEPWLQALDSWREFYGFTGTAAATLMGLMFVVLSLTPRNVSGDEGTRATRGLHTPIIAFFGTDIVIAMLVLIPRLAPSVLGALLLALALLGFGYMIASGAQAFWHAQELGADDWVWYVGLPFASYIAIGSGGIVLWTSTAGLYATAAAVMLLLITGIRNAWDLVVFTVGRK